MKSIFQQTTDPNQIRYCLSLARSYVLDYCPLAVLMITTDKNGRKMRAAIYNSGGVEVDERGNFQKNQNAPQRMSDFEYWPNSNETHPVIMCDLWLSAMFTIRKAHPELPRYDFITEQQIGHSNQAVN